MNRCVLERGVGLLGRNGLWVASAYLASAPKIYDALFRYVTVIADHDIGGVWANDTIEHRP